MKRVRALTALPLLGGLALAACQDGGPTTPLATDVELSAEDAIAVDLLSWDGGWTAALTLADVPATTMGRRGMGHGARVGVDGDLAQARLHYQEATRLARSGDAAGAARQAEAARGLLARAGQAAAGGLFAAGMVERLDDLSAQVAGDPGAYHDAAGLMGELAGLAEQARRRLHQGDSLGAAQWGVLGEQRHRQRHRGGGMGTLGPDAEIHVALGAEAVALATRLLDEQGADDEQAAYLESAAEYERLANEALDGGDLRSAAHLADLALWTALKAVVLPGGVTDEEVRLVTELAEDLYAIAAEAELTEEEQLLLDRARTLIEHGLAAVEAGSPRGVGALWRAAVLCGWIAG